VRDDDDLRASRMIGTGRVLAVVTARGGSKGLPGKNLRPLNGKPLIAWTIQQGLACGSIDSLVVSTDDRAIADVAETYGARVPYLRPAHLASDSASSMDVLLDVLDRLGDAGEQYDYLVLLEPTSPLRDVSDIDGALRLLAEGAQSVVGVARAENAHPSFLMAVRDGLLRPMLQAQPTGLRRQDLVGEYFYLEGSVYASRVDTFRERKSFYHDCTTPWIVEPYKAIEIDNLSDFIAADALMKAKLDGVLK